MSKEFVQLHKGRAWDSPANKKLLAKMPAVFVAPGRKNDGTTYYQALVGADGGLLKEDPIPLTAFKDGMSNCLLVVEGAVAVPWAAPRDVTFTRGKKLTVGGVFKKGFHGLYADGYVGRFVPRETPEPVIEALATRAGGESVDRWGLRLNPPRKQ